MKKQEFLVWMHKQRKSAVTFVRWVFFALIIGLTIGLIGGLFCIGINTVTALREQHSWILFFLPLAGVAITFFYHILGMSDDQGTNAVITTIQTGAKLSIKMLILIFCSGILTHLCGGSAGREGAALQIGGSFASKVGEIFRLNSRDFRTITLCGMSAGFAALFGTPIGAAVFAIEVISVGMMQYSALVPCMLSGLVAAGVSQSLGLSPMSFAIPTIHLNLLSLGQIMLLAILTALLSVLFCVIMHASHHQLAKWMPNRYIRAAAGGAAVVLLALLLGRDYIGIGESIIHQALSEGIARPEAFILKMIFTAITLSSGFKGGEIVPTLFIGATFGAAVGGLLGLPPAFAAGIAMIGIFCGVTNCPLASILLGTEIFGAAILPFLALTCGICYMLSGYVGLYSAQKILYSKMKLHYINRLVGKVQ